SAGAFAIRVKSGKLWRIGAFVPQGGAIAPIMLNGGAPVAADTSVTLTLQPTQTLVGWVKVGEIGLPGVQVTAAATASDPGGMTTTTDIGGNYQLPLLRPNSGTFTYPLQFWGPHFGTVRVTVTVDALCAITCA